MLVWFLLLGTVLSEPADEFKEIVGNDVGDVLNEKDDFSDTDRIITNLARFQSADLEPKHTASDDDEWSDLVSLNTENQYFKLFNEQIVKGATAKDLTFCIYDDNMREAAIALFRLFQNTCGETFDKVREWAMKNINIEMYMYALRLESVYSSKTNKSTLLPPFAWNPYYFVNGEMLSKASLMAHDVARNFAIFNIISKRNSSVTRDFVVTINTNYSGWNLHKNGQQDLMNYFREDISLNSYYLGIHLLHPFWMSNDELEYLNPRFAEHYYYAHQQLMARYNLEQLHITIKNSSYRFDNCHYVPYLKYKNGLPFPTRSCEHGDWRNEITFLNTIDIAIRECISRGLIIMQNGVTLTMADYSHINILAKLIRANLDGIKSANIIRSLAGYGDNTYAINDYNPAPSILHHPETSLKDPAYWFMIQYMLNYFTMYKKTIEPFDMSQYESNNIEIIDSDFTEFTTYFDYYQFSVSHAFSNYIKDENDWMDFLEVRQRRLKHTEFSLNFMIKSKVDKDAIARLYLGPECSINDCQNQYNDFFELDTFRFTLKEGVNNMSWSPKTSNRLSFDDYYNSIMQKATPSTKYSIFRFPENLLIPRGLKEGLNLTLFIMITPNDIEETRNPKNLYEEVSTELDSKPLGFPFHGVANSFNNTALNYKFYNITIYHKAEPHIYQSIQPLNVLLLRHGLPRIVVKPYSTTLAKCGLVDSHMPLNFFSGHYAGFFTMFSFTEKLEVLKIVHNFQRNHWYEYQDWNPPHHECEAAVLPLEPP